MDEQDERIIAWEAIAGHEFFKPAYDGDGALLPRIIEQLDLGDPVHHIWFPLYDVPVTVRLSREQLQIIQDVMRGHLATSKPGWRDYIADQIEKVLAASIDGAPVHTDRSDQ